METDRRRHVQVETDLLPTPGQGSDSSTHRSGRPCESTRWQSCTQQSQTGRDTFRDPALHEGRRRHRQSPRSAAPRRRRREVIGTLQVGWTEARRCSGVERLRPWAADHWEPKAASVPWPHGPAERPDGTASPRPRWGARRRPGLLRVLRWRLLVGELIGAAWRRCATRAGDADVHRAGSRWAEGGDLRVRDPDR